MLIEFSTIVDKQNDQKCWLYLKINKFWKMLILKFNFFTYICVKNVVVIGENV